MKEYSPTHENKEWTLGVKVYQEWIGKRSFVDENEAQSSSWYTFLLFDPGRLFLLFMSWSRTVDFLSFVDEHEAHISLTQRKSKKRENFVSCLRRRRCWHLRTSPSKAGGSFNWRIDWRTKIKTGGCKSWILLEMNCWRRFIRILSKTLKMKNWS